MYVQFGPRLIYICNLHGQASSQVNHHELMKGLSPLKAEILEPKSRANFCHVIINYNYIQIN